MSKAAASKPRRGIQSVGIGMRVLSVVAASHHPVTLSAIAERSGLSASQAHRYLVSLIEAGMVRQDRRSGSYDLDSEAISIGLAALSRLDRFALADEALRALSRDTNRTCQLAVWSERGPVIVRWFPGDPPVVTSLAIGSILPLLQSATGLVFYAFAESSMVAKQLDRELANLGKAESAYAKVKEETLRTFSAHAHGDLIPGLRATAAPVFDLQGRLVFAASIISGSNIPTCDDAIVEQALIRTCEELTIKLGGHWPKQHAGKCAS